MKLIEQVSGSFVEEAHERLAELEATLLDLETDPTNTELVAKAFRAMHTIKGSGAMFGFEAVASFTHELETVFDEIRNGRLAVTQPLIGLALQSRDLIRRLLAGDEEGTAAERSRLSQALRAFQPAPGKPATPPPKKDELFGSRPAPEITYRIFFRPKPELFRNGTNPMGLLKELAELGSARIVATTRSIPPLQDLDPEACYVHWDIVISTEKPVNTLRDVFLFVEEMCTLRIDQVDDGEIREGDDGYKKLGEILVERGDVTCEQLNACLAEQKRVGQLLVEKGTVPPEVIEAAVLEQKAVREVRAKRETQAPSESTTTLRVAADKLDDLVDLVGELVIAQARLGQLTASREDPELLSVTETIDRLAAELRDNTLSIRMVPIGTTFGRFKRLVRDLSTELHKEIDLQAEGAETELDKTVIDRLGEPLVHLIRNSCDHGIESPEVRKAAGKSVRGTVRLSAYHAGPNVFIEIRDDGAGLDADAIRNKAIERGLLTVDSAPSQQDLFKLIFAPGFTTAKAVSSVSGRGVGMDVVKRSIDALRGSVDIQSTKNQGTTIRLCLPLTLAIIEGLMVSVSESRYVLPMSLVEECVELTRADVEQSHGNSLATVRGELVPYLRLRDWFAAEGDQPPIEQIVIVSVEGKRFGFVVDGVIGQHQTVIKTLGHMYRHLEGLSGATILGDGTVALIVDVSALIRASDARMQAAS
jgi:two-component system, chemotaxis family, sensor kinase CheA